MSIQITIEMPKDSQVQAMLKSATSDLTPKTARGVHSSTTPGSQKSRILDLIRTFITDVHVVLDEKVEPSSSSGGRG